VRRGEALGLAWSAVDLDAGRISIRRTLVNVTTSDTGRVPVFSDPKTVRGTRVIALDTATVTALRDLRESKLKELALLGREPEADLVFTHWDGRAMHPERNSRAFLRRVRRLGLPVIRLHNLRHTWATLALASNVHPKVVSERLGHASITITWRSTATFCPACTPMPRKSSPGSSSALAGRPTRTRRTGPTAVATRPTRTTPMAWVMTMRNRVRLRQTARPPARGLLVRPLRSRPGRDQSVTKRAQTIRGGTVGEHLTCENAAVQRVHLLGRYSNTPEVLTDLQTVWAVVAETPGQGETQELPGLTGSGQVPRRHAIVDRLPASDIETLISLYLAGSTARALAARYSISLTAVKTLLRKRGIRRNRRSAEPS
jgi:hypothetical protein